MDSYINPLATFVPGVPRSNEDIDRMDSNGVSHSMKWVSANDPSFIVIHTMVGHADAATSRFLNPSAQVSATYGVKLDGDILQWDDEKDAPYAEGNWEYNLNSIAIEHEDDSKGGVYAAGYTDVQYVASAKLVKDICTRYGIPINRTYIIKHNEVPGSSTSCPDELDIDRIVEMANGTWVDPVPEWRKNLVKNESQPAKLYKPITAHSLVNAKVAPGFDVGQLFDWCYTTKVGGAPFYVRCDVTDAAPVGYYCPEVDAALVEPPIVHPVDPVPTIDLSQYVTRHDFDALVARVANWEAAEQQHEDDMNKRVAALEAMRMKLKEVL